MKKKGEETFTRERALADAFEHVAKVNHYMVGVIGDFTDDELDDAEQLLIARQNKLRVQKGSTFNRYERALDDIEHTRVRRRHAQNTSR